MDKIVILTGNSERNDSLIECLNILFPECEIEIQSKQTEGFEGFPIHMKENSEDHDQQANNFHAQHHQQAKPNTYS